MNILKDIYGQIISTIGSVLPETGGVLGIKDGIICAYYFDSSGKCDSNTYKPDTDNVNRVISEWEKQDIQFVGVVHSHEEKQPALSYADIVYAQAIMKANDMERILFPLGVIGNKARFIMYMVDRCGDVTAEEISLI